MFIQGIQRRPIGQFLEIENRCIIYDDIDSGMGLNDVAGEAAGRRFIEQVEMFEKNPTLEGSVQPLNDVLAALPVAIADDDEASFLKKAFGSRPSYRPGAPGNHDDFIT